MKKPVIKMAFNLLGVRIRIEAERKTQSHNAETQNCKSGKEMPLSEKIPKPPVEGRYGPGLFG